MNMKLVLPLEYIQQATELVNKANTRVFLIAMVIADHPATHQLMVALENAARRGVEVFVTADTFTYGEVSGGFLPLKYYSPGVKAVNDMVTNLKDAGVTFLWLGHGRLTLFTGRTHSKWCIIDDTCFVFGGVNVYQAGITDNTDYMFRLKDARLADRLAYEQGRISKADRTSTNYPSVTYELDGHDVLFDGGIIAQSVIYRRVTELADESKHILFVSQYCPTGKLARILKKKDVDLYFNTPEKAVGLNRLLIRLSIVVSGFSTQYKKEPYLHAKFMIFTLKDGSKITITGSHNFAYTGVLLGTREVALETKDPFIIEQLENFYSQYIKS